MGINAATVALGGTRRSDHRMDIAFASNGLAINLHGVETRLINPQLFLLKRHTTCQLA